MEQFDTGEKVLLALGQAFGRAAGGVILSRGWLRKAKPQLKMQNLFCHQIGFAIARPRIEPRKLGKSINDSNGLINSGIGMLPFLFFLAVLGR